MTLVCYIMYTVSPEVTEHFGSGYLYLTSVFVLLGLLRYIQIAVVDQKSGDPVKRAVAIVKAVTNYKDAKMLAELSEDLGEAMVGINEQEVELLMAERGK